MLRLTEIAPTLECKDGGHNATTGPCGSKLGRDDGTEGVVSAYTYTHEEPPADESTNDADSGALAADRLTECANNDDDELKTIYEQ